jgi:hypothetical protein
MVTARDAQRIERPGQIHLSAASGFDGKSDEAEGRPMTEPRELGAVRAGTADAAREQRLLLRIGAVCAIAGPLVLIASFVPHGDLPTNESALLDEAASLEYVAAHPSWLLIHTGTIVAGLLWIGAFTALAGTLTPGAAAVVGRLLATSAAVGGVFVLLDYGVDGYAFKILADEWAAASGVEQAQLQLMAETAIWFLNGTFRSEIAVFYGLTVMLAGLAVALDERDPTWFGSIAAVAGAAVVVNGLTSFAGLGLGNQDFLVFIVILPIESAWLLALGVSMWRRAGRTRPASGQTPTAGLRGDISGRLAHARRPRHPPC